MIFLNVPKVRPSDIVKVQQSQQQQQQQQTNAELEHEKSCVKRKSRSANLRRNKLFRMIFDGLHVSI